MKIPQWVWFAVVLAIWTALLGAYFGIKSDEAYKQGAVDAHALAKASLEIDQAALALQWWTGSTDMQQIRNRLCSNVYTKGVKK